MQAKARDGKLAMLKKLGRQNTSVGQWSSPGLNMSHGFIKKIQQMQMEQRRQLALKNAARANKELKAVSLQRSTKPTMQIYRPPAFTLAEIERQQQSSPPPALMTSTGGPRTAILPPAAPCLTQSQDPITSRVSRPIHKNCQKHVRNQRPQRAALSWTSVTTMGRVVFGKRQHHSGGGARSHCSHRKPTDYSMVHLRPSRNFLDSDNFRTGEASATNFISVTHLLSAAFEASRTWCKL
ncbi:hypothetical protein MRX96_001107 [Rhipicephalus microplus]